MRGTKNSEALPKPERVPRHTQFRLGFGDITLPPDIPNIGDYYYKSECRPLIKLHPYFSKIQTSHTIPKLGRKIPTFREWLDLRDRCRKDLYWLGKECIATPESGSGFVEHVHREMIEQFVKKDFDGVYHKGWTLDEARQAFERLKREKEMLLLCPAGAFKSTTNKVDATQWMLNFPDVRIFIMTGSGQLSKKFLKEVKGFFFKPKGAIHTWFQCLFPEYVIEGEDGTSMAPLFSPARMHPQPGTPTLWVNSIDGAVAGWHCDVWKGDDIVNEDNSNTEETRESLKNRYDNISQNRPDKWAFRDHLGTRYHPEDWYGSRIDEARRYAETNQLKYLCRSAWTVKAQFQHVPIKKLQEHMVDLYFPEFMPFKTLIHQCRQNEKNFRCQKLNEPAGGDVAIHFDEKIIQDHTILLNAVPKPDGASRQPVIMWDTAHEEKNQSDYSAGAVGWVNPETRSLYVLEVCHGKWVDSKVAIELVDLHWKWNALFSEVEKFHGWQLFAAEVQRVSLRRYGKMVPLLWREADVTEGSKRNWVKGLEVLIANDRLWFVDGDWMETTTQQFVRFTGLSTRRKDDIPDAISRLQRMIPKESVIAEESYETSEERKEREAREMREKFAARQNEIAYGTVFQAPASPPPAPQPEPETVAAGPAWIFGNSGIHL